MPKEMSPTEVKALLAHLKEMGVRSFKWRDLEVQFGHPAGQRHMPGYDPMKDPAVLEQLGEEAPVRKSRNGQ